MALRPPVSKYLRLVFFPPVALLKLLLELVAGRLFGLIAYAFSWLSNGAKVHLWRVVLIARRWTLSVPTWTVEDTLADPTFQPITNVQREAAKADPRLRRIDCPCGRKSCRFPHGTYVPNLLIPMGSIRSFVQSELERLNPGITVGPASIEVVDARSESEKAEPAERE